MRILVTGADGQLGYDVMREITERGHEGIASDLYVKPSLKGQLSVKMDITDAGSVRDTIMELKPDAVIHCAAWTDVDAAEKEENRETVRRVNAEGTRNVAGACMEAGAKILYPSTDYVFSGEGNRLWEPDGTDFRPVNWYGRTKLEGEREVLRAERFFIVRTAWVFGVHGKNFVRTMIRAGKAGGEVRVVDDQFGTPTYTRDLSRLFMEMIGTEDYGIYHATNEGGYISRCDFCREIYRQTGTNARVIPVRSSEYGGVKRPLNARLNREKLAEHGFTPLPPWQDALARFLREVPD